MAPKKKAAGGKSGKDETPEEKQARLEQEAQAAKDKELKRAEAARVALRQRQLREQECARINAIKIHNQWRKIMRLAKADELRQQIEILSQNHEREVDRKDALIQMLDRDLEEAEEQYQLAVRAHMVVVDQLLDLQYSHTSSLEAQYNADLAALQEEFDTERAEITASHGRLKKDMQDMASAMQVEFGEADNDAKQEFESAREELKNRDSEDYNVLKIQLEGIIEELERHFEQAHRAYLEGTEHRNVAFKTLLKNDSEAAKVIEQRMKKLVKLQEELQHWRTKIATNTREWEERNGALRREKELMSRHYAQLKAALDGGRQQQAARLKALSINAGEAIKELRKKLAKAESILKLAEVCRKMETEQEKVLPFWSLGEAVPVPESPCLPQEVLEQMQEQAAMMEEVEQAEDRMGETSTSGQGATGSKPLLCSQMLSDAGLSVAEHQALERFFKRYNKVLLDKAAIDQQKQRLEQENGDLRQLLKGFLDGISVNADVLNTPANPLLVVNNRLQLLMTERKKARTRAAAEAAAAAAASAKAAAAGTATGAPMITIHAVSAI